MPKSSHLSYSQINKTIKRTPEGAYLYRQGGAYVKQYDKYLAIKGLFYNKELIDALFDCLNPDGTLSPEGIDAINESAAHTVEQRAELFRYQEAVHSGRLSPNVQTSMRLAQLRNEDITARYDELHGTQPTHKVINTLAEEFSLSASSIRTVLFEAGKLTAAPAKKNVLLGLDDKEGQGEWARYAYERADAAARFYYTRGHGTPTAGWFSIDAEKLLQYEEYNGRRFAVLPEVCPYLGKPFTDRYFKKMAYSRDERAYHMPKDALDMVIGRKDTTKPAAGDNLCIMSRFARAIIEKEPAAYRGAKYWERYGIPADKFNEYREAVWRSQ